MLAAVIEKPETIMVRKVEKPLPAEGEILIRIEYCLLCTWEQRIFTGKSGITLPFIAGHEAAGIIEEIPEGTETHFKEGDNVVFKTLDHCGHCTYCYQGYDNQCIGKAKKRFYGGIPGSGGLGQYIALDVKRIFRLYEEISLLHAAFTEPLACCIHSINRSSIQFGETVVVIGAGIMGQLHTSLSLLQGARVVVIEPMEERRSLALKRGATVVIDPFTEEVNEKLRDITQGEGADVIFITTNNPDIITMSLSGIRKMGRIVLYGSFHPNKNIPLDPNMVHYSEVIVTGSYGPATTDFLKASRLLSYGIVSVEDFIHEIYPLKEIAQAMKASLLPESYRVAVKMY